MNDQIKSQEQTDVSPVVTAGVDQGRRRLGKLGAAGTAAVLTVASRSAVAGWGQCTGSELASGNLSRTGSPNPCGCSPGFWWNNNGIALWNNLILSPIPVTSKYPLRNALFNTVFDVDFYTGQNVLLMDVGPHAKKDNKFNANDNTGMHAVAALLNAMYYGSRYPSVYNTASAVKTAFQNACTIGTKQAFTEFVSMVDVYKTTDLWCNGSPETGTGY